MSSVAREVVLPKVSDAECTRYWSVNTKDRLCAGYNLAAMGICSVGVVVVVVVVVVDIAAAVVVAAVVVIVAVVAYAIFI